MDDVTQDVRWQTTREIYGWERTRFAQANDSAIKLVTAAGAVLGVALVKGGGQVASAGAGVCLTGAAVAFACGCIAIAGLRYRGPLAGRLLEVTQGDDAREFKRYTGDVLADATDKTHMVVSRVKGWLRVGWVTLGLSVLGFALVIALAG